MSIADKLTEVAENVPKVFEAGKRAEYDAFWDAFQNYGANAAPAQFAGNGWTLNTFNPKYNIKVSNGYFMFCQNATKTDMVELFKQLNIKLDTSEMTSAQYLFWNSQFSRVGEIDFRKLQTSEGHTSQTFANGWLVTIDKIILREDGTNTFASNIFQNSTRLENITFEGVIGRSINFQYSPLTKASITNIVEHLSSTATGQTVTFKKTAKEAAFAADEWAALIADKTNWTFSLV